MKLRIGLHDFAVVPTRKEDKGDCGCMDWHCYEIRIRPSMSPVRQCETLIHELLHGAYEMTGNSGKEMPEEAVCELLDGPLTMIFRDNPELFAVLMQGLQRGQPIV